MKTKSLLLIYFLFLSIVVSGKELKYVVSDIPKSLLAYSKAVVRKSETELNILDVNKAVLTKVYAVSILNKNGLPLSIFNEVYDKFTSVKNIKAHVYDQYGNEVNKGLNTEILDIAAIPGYSLYDDFRVKILDLKYATIPFTVEFSYEISYNGLLSYPSWFTNNDFNVSTEQASLTILTPYNFKIRYLERNLNSSVNIYDNHGTMAYEWKVSSLPAFREEPFSPSLMEYSPAVLLAPCNFEIGGYEGNCESWQKFGLWFIQLYANKRILDEDTKRKLKSLVAEDTSKIEKVRKLYEYMQNKVRYVSVQVGIGGWQPIDAESVEKVSYGDCKALSNYMRAMLNSVGIRSHYALVGAGEDATPLLEEFPSNQFNHVIVCVPLKLDSLWLECTDQEIPFGFLGTFTDDRKVLLIGEGGGYVVKTKQYSLSDNSQVRNATVTIDEYGNATSTSSTDYRGIKYDVISRILRQDDFDKKKSILEKINIPHCNLVNFSYNETKTINPSIKEKLNIDIPEFGSILDGKMMFRPNFLNCISNIPLRIVERKSPIIIRRSFSETDSITFILKSSYNSNHEPLEYSLKSAFGEFEYKITFDNKKIYYLRKFTLKKGRFSAGEYNAFIDFFSSIQTADNIQILIDKL